MTNCGCSTAAAVPAVLAQSSDTGHLVPAAGGAEIALHYERLPLRPRFRVGDALPLLPTGERYAAMRLTDWLAARGDPVTLPFMDRDDSAFRFGRTELLPRYWQTTTAITGRPVRGAGRAAN